MQSNYSSNHYSNGPPAEIKDVRYEFSKIFYENELDAFTNADQIGFIDINKLDPKQEEIDEKDIENPLSKREDYVKFLSSPIGKFAISHHKQPTDFSPLWDLSPLTKVGQVANKAENGNSELHNASNNYLSRNFPLFSKEADYYPLRRFDDSDRPTFTNRRLHDDDELFMQNEDSLGMVWNNDGAKSQIAEKEVIEKEEPFEKKICMDSNTFNEALFKDDFWKTKNASSSLSQTNNSLNEEEIAKQPSSIIVKKEISQSEHDDGSEEEDEDDFDYMPQKTRSKKRTRITTDHGNEEVSSNRKFRGLRYLSQKVKDIVLAKQQTTYKEVADILTEDFSNLKKANIDFPKKEEQNVKRRVYDALNVLIAANILKKKAKMVLSNGCALNTDKKVIERHKIMKKKLAVAKAQIASKREILSEMIYKKLAIKNLMKINKDFGVNRPPIQRLLTENTRQLPPNLEVKCDEEYELMNFPLIVLSMPNNTKSKKPSDQPNLVLDMSTDRRELKVTAKTYVSIMGDIDILTGLNLHKTSKDFFNQSIEQELHKYIPSEFIKNLK